MMRHEERNAVPNDPISGQEEQGLVSLKESLTKNYVIFGNSYPWKPNEKFRRMVESQVLKFPELPIDQFAMSIVRHWTTKMDGGFVQENSSMKGVIEDISEEDILSRIHRMMQSIRCESSPNLSNAPKVTPDHEELKETKLLQDIMAESKLPQFDDPLHPNDFHNDVSTLLPITKDIFDHPFSPSNSPCKLRRASLNKVEQVERLTRKLNDSNRNISLPPRKRFKMHNINLSNITPVDTLTIKQSNDEEIRKSSGKSLTSQNQRIPKILQNDILFDETEGFSSPGRGNQALREWLPQFVNQNTEIKAQASRVVELFSLLSCRFYKRLQMKNELQYVEMERKDSINEIKVMIESLLKKNDMTHRQHKRDEQDGTSKCTQRVPFLGIDVCKGILHRNTKFLTVRTEACSLAPLWTHDLIFDSQLAKDCDDILSFGNLFFLHHADRFMQSFQRSVSVAKKLSLIMEILTGWEKGSGGMTRFIAPVEGRLGKEYHILDDEGDKISIYVGVVRMLVNDLLPACPKNYKMQQKIHLTEKWTIRHGRQISRLYQRALEDNFEEFASIAQVANDHKRALSERLIAERIVDSNRFILFDKKEKRWQPIASEEAVSWTLMCLRLKTFFSGQPSSDFAYEKSNSGDIICDAATQSPEKTSTRAFNTNPQHKLSSNEGGKSIHPEVFYRNLALGSSLQSEGTPISSCKLTTILFPKNPDLTPIKKGYLSTEVAPQFTPAATSSFPHTTVAEARTPASSVIGPSLESRLLLLQSPSPSLSGKKDQIFLNDVKSADELPSMPQDVDCLSSQSLSLQPRFSFESGREFQQRIRNDKMDSSSPLGTGPEMKFLNLISF